MSDWSEVERHRPALVVFPRTPQQVAAVLVACSSLDQPVVVQGGLTGLADDRLLTMLNRVTKNSTGVDLKHLFIGAEGTLGVITRPAKRCRAAPGGCPGA